jgi:hypothetical protein
VKGDDSRVWAHLVNHKKRDRSSYWVHVGGWLHGLPRLTIGCRLFGHRPAVDGSTRTAVNDPGYRPARWVACDRCGLRPEPQGSLNPDVWNIGDRYDGPHQPLVPRWSKATRWTVGDHPPGPWPPHPTGVLGFEFVAGRGHGEWSGYGFQFKVGNAGSEHTLAFHVYAGPAALYLHTEGFGEWLVRRLNPVDLYSRETGIRFVRGGIEWKVWSMRDNPRGDREPWWRRGEISLRWRDKLFGPKRYSYTDIAGGEVARVVRMPEGEYLVNLKLQEVRFGRRRGRKVRSYSVDWEALGQGIPTKGPLRGRVVGSHVKVPEIAVRAGTWPAEAVAGIAKQITTTRTRYEWEPTGKVRVDAAAPA